MSYCFLDRKETKLLLKILASFSNRTNNTEDVEMVTGDSMLRI